MIKISLPFILFCIFLPCRLFANDYYVEVSVANPDFYNNSSSNKKSKDAKYPLALDFIITSDDPSKKITIENSCSEAKSIWIAYKECDSDKYHFFAKFHLKNLPKGTHLLQLKPDYIEDYLSDIEGHRIKPSKISDDKLEMIKYNILLVNLTTGKVETFSDKDFRIYTNGKKQTAGIINIK